MNQDPHLPDASRHAFGAEIGVPPAVVVAIGNPIAGDDAAGPLVARRLRELDPAARVVELTGEPTPLLDAWEGARLAIVVDAVVSGAEPGTVHRLDVSERPVPGGVSALSTHAIGLGAAIELARALGRLPARVVVYGIEGRSGRAGSAPDPAVTESVETVAAMVAGELAALGPVQQPDLGMRDDYG